MQSQLSWSMDDKEQTTVPFLDGLIQASEGVIPPPHPGVCQPKPETGPSASLGELFELVEKLLHLLPVAQKAVEDRSHPQERWVAPSQLA